MIVGTPDAPLTMKHGRLARRGGVRLIALGLGLAFALAAPAAGVPEGTVQAALALVAAFVVGDSYRPMGTRG